MEQLSHSHVQFFVMHMATVKRDDEVSLASGLEVDGP